MKRVLKWLGIGAGGLAGVSVLAIAGIYGVSQKKIAQRFDVTPEAVAVAYDDATLARGRHVSRAISKCVDCHGADYAGRTFLNDPMLGRIVAPNLTPAGVTAGYTDADWVRAIRHGVKRDGRSALIMPSYEFWHLTDQDLGALVAFLKALPPVMNDTLPKMRLGPMGRFIIATGAFPALAATAIDHDAPRPAPPAVAETAEYGKYLAAVGCVGCHGPSLHGGAPPAPPAPDITTASGVTSGWTLDDFRIALRAGLRPDGTKIDTSMPWNLTTELSDVEIGALWAYINSLSPTYLVAGAR